jgi:hypothetical protein
VVLSLKCAGRRGRVGKTGRPFGCVAIIASVCPPGERVGERVGESGGMKETETVHCSATGGCEEEAGRRERWVEKRLRRMLAGGAVVVGGFPFVWDVGEGECGCEWADGILVFE